MAVMVVWPSASVERRACRRETRGSVMPYALGCARLALPRILTHGGKRGAWRGERGGRW